MIRTKPPSDVYRDGWDRVFGDGPGYRVVWSEADKEFVGLCDAFPSLSWLAATEREALDGIKRLVEQP